MDKSEFCMVTGEPTKDTVLIRVGEPLSKLNDLSVQRVFAYVAGIVTGNGVKKEE